MVTNIGMVLASYEQDFISFQRILPRLRESNPDQFVALKGGKIVSSGKSIEEVKKNLDLNGIDPSETVIEFVSKEEIRVIV